MIHRLRYAVVCAALAALGSLVLLTATDAIGQQQAPELPQEVKAWLEFDQTRRWAAQIETGQELFAEGSCYRCHGEGGTGGGFGPDLTDTEWVQGDGSLANIRETIMWGVRRRDFADPDRRFQMNPAGGMDLDGAKLNALAAYVWSLSNGDFLQR
jgi:mono/diheme cytochrome c family protein